ncbi:MAG: hypothetical protein LIP77_09210 [Planctomycetes bacterium]|nr:hypothetical protein [Planctomycetota bacterium]
MWDYETTFSERQVLGDVISDNTVDVGADDIGLGEPVYVQVSLSAGCQGELTVAVETGDSADMAGCRTLAEYLVDERNVVRGGTVLAAPLPTGCGRYLRLQYSGAEGGRVTAGLVQAAHTSGLR